MAHLRVVAPKAAVILALTCALASASLAQSTPAPVSSDEIQDALSGTDKIDDINAIIQIEIPAAAVPSQGNIGVGFSAVGANAIIGTKVPKKPARTPPPQLILIDSSRSIDLPVNFAYDSADLSPEATAQLDELAKVLTQPEFVTDRFLIAGHTDAAGGADYNLALSDRRAQSVLAYLTEAFDLPKDRFVVAGFGETRLADPENSRDAINRRVEIAVLAN